MILCAYECDCVRMYVSVYIYTCLRERGKRRERRREGGGRRGGKMRPEGKEEKGDEIEMVKDKESKIKGRKICTYK